MNLPKFLDSLPLTSHNHSDPTLKEALVPTDPEQPPSDHQEILIGQPLPTASPQNKSLSEPITAPNSTTSLPYIHYGQYGPINPNQAYYPINNLQTLNPAFHDPTRPLSYHEFHLAGFPGCWRPVIGMLGLVAGLSIAAPLFWYAVLAFLYNLSGNTFEIDPELKIITPGVLAFMNLALASAIPITWFLARELHGIKAGWLSSVKSKIRWAWLRDCLGISVIALLATIAVSWILTVLVENPDGNPSSTESSEPGESADTIRDFVIVILLLTPLQAAGEEFAFRGYLTQAFGGLCSRRWVAVLVPATLFAMAHGSQTAPVFLDRFAFGLVTGLLVILTGGLEAGIAMHVLNNLLAFGSALTMNDINAAMKADTGSWWRVPVTLTQSVVFYVLTMKMARRRGIETTVVKSEVNGQNNMMPVQSFYPVTL